MVNAAIKCPHPISPPKPPSTELPTPPRRSIAQTDIKEKPPTGEEIPPEKVKVLGVRAAWKLRRSGEEQDNSHALRKDTTSAKLGICPSGSVKIQQILVCPTRRRPCVLHQSSRGLFPRNRINLQYAVSAEVIESTKKGEEETSFAITTDERRYLFKADSVASAKEWTKSIQKVIFRTHNEGNSVKISLPIQNVLEIEESSILDLANTVKVRVIDNDETFAIDEDALNVLRIMINDNEHHQGDREVATPTGQRNSVVSPTRTGATPHISENVRATLSPLPAPHTRRSSTSEASTHAIADVTGKGRDVRRSMDASRTFQRSSYEVRRPSHEGRRSFSGGTQYAPSKARPGDRSPQSPRVADSESATLSLDPGTESSAAIQSMDESNASASQILDRSDVFRAPNHPPAINKLDHQGRHSQETTRSSQLKSPNSGKRDKHPKPRQVYLISKTIPITAKRIDYLVPPPRYRILPPIRFKRLRA
ncbi:Sterol 3-beta-glucosyltransferase [Pyrenophora tritici-repentis]|nr:Sterol 3-beta-glucosyltransferase [Pyrenophora tritici-repentis]